MRPTHSWHFIFKRRRPCNPGQGCRLASPPVLRQARRSGHNDVSHCGWRHAPSAPVTLGSFTVGILRRGIASRNATDAGYATYLQRLVQSKNTNRQKHTAPVTPFPLLPSGRGHEGEEATAPPQKLSRPWQARAGLFTGVCVGEDGDGEHLKGRRVGRKGEFGDGVWRCGRGPTACRDHAAGHHT